MKQIIIIGTGKAAMLHYRAYCMFVARENIFFIDPYFKQSNDEIIVFPDVEEALEKINIAKKNIFVDICTPCSEFINLIKKCKNNGVYNIIIEKPFIIDSNALNSLCDGLNLVMIQNYLYSVRKILTRSTNIEYQSQPYGIFHRVFARVVVPRKLETSASFIFLILNYFYKHELVNIKENLYS